MGNDFNVSNISSGGRKMPNPPLRLLININFGKPTDTPGHIAKKALKSSYIKGHENGPALLKDLLRFTKEFMKELCADTDYFKIVKPIINKNIGLGDENLSLLLIKSESYVKQKLRTKLQGDKSLAGQFLTTVFAGAENDTKDTISRWLYKYGSNINYTLRHPKALNIGVIAGVDTSLDAKIEDLTTDLLWFIHQDEHNIYELTAGEKCKSARKSRRASRAARTEKTSAPRSRASGSARTGEIDGARGKLGEFKRRVEVKTPERGRIPEVHIKGLPRI